jgi:Zn-dependent M28 family amino/carboxypeptidase
MKTICCRTLVLWLVAAAAGACAAPQAKPAPQASSAASAARFDSNRAWEHLRRQVAFGPRPAGSTALDDCRRYLLEQLKAAGITATEQRFVAKTPLGDTRMANVVATIPGRRRERIILASHFDTKRAPFRFVGANDGASSTAVLLELGRVLKVRQNDLTIELLFLDGEEATNWDWGVTGVDNTYGSRHYVQEAQKAGTLSGIRAMLLLDMVGERGAVFQREGHSTPWLVDIVWGAARQLGHAASFPNERTEIDDDHVAFLRAGVPAADIIDLDYPQWHKAEDDLDHVDVRTLQIVGDVVLASLPGIEKRQP